MIKKIFEILLPFLVGLAVIVPIGLACWGLSLVDEVVRGYIVIGIIGALFIYFIGWIVILLYEMLTF